jgi:crossover junction endodeoxyribonuclease RuvC
MRVLGIDPGLRITGYACVEPGGRTGTRLVEAGVIRLAPAGKAPSVSTRLAELDRDVRALLDRLRPDLAAVEALFAHPTHPATAITMAHARGVILLAIAQRAIPLAELRPAEVKKSLTGSGRAQKSQMQRAIQAVFDLPKPPSPPDVADALAIAATALARAGARV